MSVRAPAGDYLLIPIGQLRAGPNARRKVGDVGELAASISSQGIVQPLLVHELGDSFQIIAGHRRWAAAKLTGLKELPCVVRPAPAGLHNRFAALVENIQRRDLEPIEEAKAIAEFLDEHDMTQREVAVQLGKSQSWVARRLLLLELPKAVQKKVASREIGIDRALEYSAAPAPSAGPVDLFEADDDLNRAWRALRQDAIDSGDRTTIRLLSEFARAFKSYKAMLERKHVPVGSL